MARTVRVVFGLSVLFARIIVAIPTQLVVIPFLKVPFLVKTHAHRTDSLAQKRLFLFLYF